MRNMPPNETAGFGRVMVSGCKRSPLPPANMNACVHALNSSRVSVILYLLYEG